MESLFCRHIGDHLAVCSIHTGAADVADEVGVGVDDGKPTGGTHQTLEYAKQRNLEMELLLPE